MVQLGPGGDGIRPTEDPSFFEIKATKRGGRIGWKGDSGRIVTKRHIAHSLVQGQLFWREPGADEVPTSKTDEMVEMLILDLVPAEGTMEKKELIAECKINDVKEKSAREAIKRLIGAKKLQEVKVPRTSAPPEIHVARVPQPAIQTDANCTNN